MASRTPTTRARSCTFLSLFGPVAIGLQWVRMAKVVLARETGGQDTAFYQAKRETGRYHMARELPATRMLRARIETGARPVLSLAPEAF